MSSSQQMKDKGMKSVCFTNLICNKSFCRSISNNKFNVLIKRNITSHQMIKDILQNKVCRTEDEQVFLQFSHFQKILLKLRDNFRLLSKDDFKKFFISIRTTNDELKPIDVLEITKILIFILEKMVPCEFYGSNKNKKMFYNLIRFIMKGMLHQHVTYEKITYLWDVDKIPWLKDCGYSYEFKLNFLCKVLVWLLKNTVCSIIAVRFYVTVTKLSHEVRKLYFYFKEDWQNFNDKVIARLIKNGDIIKSESNSLGCRYAKKLSMSCRTEKKFFLKRLPVMRLMLKSNSSVRIIIRYKKLGLLQKKIINNRRNMFKCIFPKTQFEPFYKKYIELNRAWKAHGEPKLYFVKADLLDAFGSVDIGILKRILTKLHLDFQNNEKNLEKKKSVAKEFHKLILDLKKPVLVRMGSCSYEWKRGLIQGMRFSPILCEIFYNSSDMNNFSEFVTEPSCEIKFFLRFVDDYLFITDSISLAIKFLKVMTESGRINSSKTVCNFTFLDIDASSKIPFLGYIINTHTLEVTRDEKVFSGQVCYRIYLNSNISEPIKFLETRITQTTVPLSPLLFNVAINSEQTIWNNIFVTLCISANKFCSIINLIYTDAETFNANNVFHVYKKKVAVRMCDAIVKIVFESNLKFIFCINHLRFLAYKALSLFACKSNICSRFINILKIALKKTNCLEGSWKPHSKIINRAGQPIQAASKEICQTQNIIKYFQEFSNIPKSFEAYIK